MPPFFSAPDPWAKILNDKGYIKYNAAWSPSAIKNKVWICPSHPNVIFGVGWNSFGAAYGQNARINVSDTRYQLPTGTDIYVGGGLHRGDCRNPGELATHTCAGWDYSSNPPVIEYRPSYVTNGDPVRPNAPVGFWHRGRTVAVFVDGHSASFNIQEAVAPYPAKGVGFFSIKN